MSPRLDDVMFEYEFDLSEPVEQKARYLAGEAGVSVNLFLVSVLSQILLGTIGIVAPPLAFASGQLQKRTRRFLLVLSFLEAHHRNIVSLA